MSSYYEDLYMYLSPKIGMDRIESNSARSTSTLTTCSATSSADFSEVDGMEFSASVWSPSPTSPLARMSYDESFSSIGCSTFKKLKRSREPSEHSSKAALAESTAFCDEASQAKRQNVPLLRPVARYLHVKHSQELPILSRPYDRPVTPKSMCATLGIFKPVDAQDVMCAVTARTASRANPTGRDRQNVESNGNSEAEDEPELASFFQENSDKSGAAVHIEEINSSSSVFHREGTCDPLMCIFNMDL